MPLGAMVCLLALLAGASRAAGERMLPGSGDLGLSWVTKCSADGALALAI